MERRDLIGKAQTVLGPIEPEDLGITLHHDHLLTDLSVWFDEPTTISEKWKAYQPLSLEILGWVRANEFRNRDNIFMADKQMAIKEAMYYKIAGGRTIVDPITSSFGRDPLALAGISQATGLNVIMGSGYYLGESVDMYIKSKSEEELAEEIIKEILVGVDDTGVHSGVIGEIATSAPLTDTQKKSLRAASLAQQRTGSVVYIHHHCDASQNILMEIATFLDKSGADLSRVIMCHIDMQNFPLNTRLELLKTGCCLAYDTFGKDRFMSVAKAGVVDSLDDVRSIRQIAELIEKGYLSQILISQDTASKIDLVSYGGYGYAHILENVIPHMRARGISSSEINTILVDNPKRILTFV